MISFLKFMELEEELHPELTKAIEDENMIGKAGRITDTIQKLKDADHDTGIVGKPNKGSSRMYVKAMDPEKVIVDGKPHDVHYGVKTAVESYADKYINKKDSGRGAMGRLQNAFENGNDSINKEHRVLIKKDDGTYSYNPHGIFPPLLDHDSKNHVWSKVGHVRNMNHYDFENHTRNDEYPEGITHDDFQDALERNYDNARGRYHIKNDMEEKRLSHIDKHPLVRAFIDHQVKHNAPPHDFRLENLGIFRHNKVDHIVARDHGFSEDAKDAYIAANTDAMAKKNQSSLQKQENK